ncbi:hypothetical protein F0225_18660 [Vibrio pectenicida]|uniref:Uncharacterized protein n=1 Tax=Vibrio pectenicida TaxID=62763 RepID=A0A7Y4EG08_9VIBR|nr:hypothetical protein [Vibrio pectenicida]NOH73339.1 hypothetical protein [Vibrio pectenicida]
MSDKMPTFWHIFLIKLWRAVTKLDNFEQRVNAALIADGDLVHHYQTRWPKGHTSARYII